MFSCRNKWYVSSSPFVQQPKSQGEYIWCDVLIFPITFYPCQNHIQRTKHIKQEKWEKCEKLYFCRISMRTIFHLSGWVHPICKFHGDKRGQDSPGIFNGRESLCWRRYLMGNSSQWEFCPPSMEHVFQDRDSLWNLPRKTVIKFSSPQEKKWVLGQENMREMCNSFSESHCNFSLKLFPRGNSFPHFLINSLFILFAVYIFHALRGLLSTHQALMFHILETIKCLGQKYFEVFPLTFST